jgi:hypothetical protein
VEKDNAIVRVAARNTPPRSSAAEDWLNSIAASTAYVKTTACRIVTAINDARHVVTNTAG